MVLCVALARRSAASPFPTGSDLLVCAGRRASLGAIGITALYRGLAIGRMGIVAPVTGVLAAVIPVVAGIVIEGLPGAARHRRDRPRGRRGRPRLARRGRGGRPGRAHRGAGRRRRRSACSASRSPSSSEGDVFAALAVIRLVQASCSSSARSLVTRSAWRPPRRSLLRRSSLDRRARHGRQRLLPRWPSRPASWRSRRSSRRSTRSRPSSSPPSSSRERVTRDHAIGIVLAGVAIALIGARQRLTGRGPRALDRRAPRPPRARRIDDRVEALARQLAPRSTVAPDRGELALDDVAARRPVARAAFWAWTTAGGRSSTIATTGRPRRGPAGAAVVGACDRGVGRVDDGQATSGEAPLDGPMQDAERDWPTRADRPRRRRRPRGARRTRRSRRARTGGRRASTCPSPRPRPGRRGSGRGWR